MPDPYTLSEDLQADLQFFFNSHDAALLNQNLRRMLVDFLDYELRIGVPVYLEGFLFPLNSLMDILDRAAKELQAHDLHNKIKEHSGQPALTTKDKVIDFLVASLSPSAIFLLHQHTDNNNATHFDLLVVLPSTSKTSFTYYEQVISLAAIDAAVITVSLHKEDTLQQQLQEGHIYYSIHCKQENLVYSTSNFKLAVPGATTLQALSENAIHVFETAHKKADSFLHGAANYRGESDNEMTAFMLQQAIEIMLRGLITALLGSCVKTHCLRELKKPLQRCAPEMRYLISEDATEENRLLALLEKAYLEGRYSREILISNTDIDILAEGAEVLHNYVQKVFEKIITHVQ